MKFFSTVSTIWRNPFINRYRAVWNHISWQFRKAANGFPYDVRLRGRCFRVADRTVANGCGALLNAMGYYDPNNMHLIEELFEHSVYETFFDIGANIGVYSVIAAGGGNARVYAFEPHPYTFGLLRENVLLNHLSDRVSCFQFALAEKNGSVHFTDVPGSSINHFTSAGDPGGIRIPVFTGYTVCADHGLRADVMKIDVEEVEDSVLSGFGACLSETDLIFVECRSVRDTSRLLNGKFGYLGPFKTDYRARLFVRQEIHQEDWVFVHPHALEVLRGNSFRVDE